MGTYNFKTIDLFGCIFNGINNILFDYDENDNTIVQLSVWNTENNQKQIKKLRAKKYDENLMTKTYQFTDKNGINYYIKIDKN